MTKTKSHIKTSDCAWITRDLGVYNDQLVRAAQDGIFLLGKGVKPVEFTLAEGCAHQLTAGGKLTIYALSTDCRTIIKHIKLDNGAESWVPFGSRFVTSRGFRNPKILQSAKNDEVLFNPTDYKAGDR